MSAPGAGGRSLHHLDPESFAFRFLLGITTATQAVGTTITLPAIPAIADSFDVGADTAQLTLTGFLLGVSAGQIVCGALADRFGRRPVILAGLTLFTFAGIGSAVASSIEVLIVFRTVQGMGGAAGMIVGRAMVRDLFDGERAVKMMAFITSVIALVPMAAPMLGSFLLEIVSWRATLGAVAGLSAPTAVVIMLCLGETLRRPDLQATRPRIVLANIERYFRIPQCSGFAAVMVCAFGGVFAALSLLPYIAIRVFHLSSAAAAASVAALAISVLAGSRVGSLMSGRVSQRRTLAISTSLALVSALWLLVTSLLAVEDPSGFVMLVVPAAVYACAYGITQPNCISAALQPVPDIAGLASAVNGSMQMATGGLFAWLGGALFDGTPSAIGICVVLGGSSSFVSYLLVARRPATS